MTELLRFGRFEFDPLSENLFRAGKPLNLQEKPRKILKVLLENPGQIVHRQILIERLWPDGTHVDFDNNLNASIRKLREALGDSADRALYVKTIPRKGYCFVAPLQNHAVHLPEKPENTSRIKPVHIFSTALVAFLLGLAFAFFWPSQTTSDKVMLAFLPLKILGDDQELQVLGDGLNEELIVQAGRFDPQHLGVIAGTSARTYRDTDKTIAQIGRELGVDYLVEGTLQEEAAKLRMTTQLIRVRDQTQVWSKVYHREMTQLFPLRREIGLDIAQHLSHVLTKQWQLQPEAILAKGDYQDFLKARYHMSLNKVDGFEKARQLLENLLIQSPDFSPGHALLAEAYTLQAIYGALPQGELYRKGSLAAQKAITLDPKNGLALATMGYNLLYGHWDWHGAGEFFKRALAAAPGSAKTQSAAASWFSVVGRHAEAVEAAERAQLLDPFSLNVNNDLAWYYYYAGDIDRALRQRDHILELDPNNQNYCAMLCYWVKGEHAKGLALVQALLPATEAIQSAFAKACAEGHDAANTWLVTMLRRSANDQNDYLLANRLTALGHHEEAIQVIKSGWQKRLAWAAYAPVDPGFRDLFSHAHFQELVRDMNLPVVLKDKRYVPHPAQL